MSLTTKEDYLHHQTEYFTESAYNPITSRFLYNKNLAIIENYDYIHAIMHAGRNHLFTSNPFNFIFKSKNYFFFGCFYTNVNCSTTNTRLLLLLSLLLQNFIYIYIYIYVYLYVHIYNLMNQIFFYTKKIT